MSNGNVDVSTGLHGLDEVLRGIIPGDNIVWQVESLEDYRAFVEPYLRFALENQKTLVYFRFARHKPLVDEKDPSVRVVSVSPEEGFETFIAQIHRVIEESGYGAFYVFDCLSDLVVDWYSDRMLGNFFRLTCPYLYDLRTIAYFALLKDHHSFHALKPIMDTTQLFLNVYHHRDTIYVHPLKVQQRYSPTIHTLHEWAGEAFKPVTRSVTISEILTSGPWSRVESTGENQGPWHSIFLQAGTILRGMASGEYSQEEGEQIFKRLLRIAITRNEKLLRLAEQHLTLSDLISIRKRMIGTGLIGGKAVGFLLARAILNSRSDRWNEILESHDSFFVGSDVFYTFLVENGCWWIHQKQKNSDAFLENAEEGRQRIQMGKFPEYILDQFADMLDYFGQSPIIVRSSSLQEDNFGNSFVGKYESVFCPNQGPRQRRMDDFVTAVKTVYASTMSEKALRYRARRGILDQDEQMALLVQRVSGDQYSKFYYPQTAGVGLSFNPYVWGEYIDPAAGMLRLVFGLGTRAVDRSDDDYTRIVALNDPMRRPEASFSEIKQHAQRRADVLDLDANRLMSINFMEVAKNSPGLPLHIFSSPDKEIEAEHSTAEESIPPRVLTFEHLLQKTRFVDDMKEMLRVLQEAYECPVDIEFATNFFDDGNYRINLLQCRPLQVKEGGPVVELPDAIPAEDRVLEAHGAVIGYSRLDEVDRLIYVVPEEYSNLLIKDRYSIAHLIGKILNAEEKGGSRNVMLIGPGRWGTATPSLGVPVTFSQINRISFLCEVVTMHDGLVPDVSLGTHFFNELVEADILYLALFPNQKDNFLSKEFFDESKNMLPEMLPGEAKWERVVRVIDPHDHEEGTRMKINANALRQEVVCYMEKQPQTT